MSRDIIMDLSISLNFIYLMLYWSFFFRIVFLKNGEGKEKEREKNIDVREKHKSVSSHTHPDKGLNLLPRHVPW